MTKINKVVHVCSEDRDKVFRKNEGGIEIGSGNHTKKRKRKHIQSSIWGN